MYTQERTIKDILLYSTVTKNKERDLENIKLLKHVCPNILSGYNNLHYIELTLKEIKLTR